MPTPPRLPHRSAVLRLVAPPLLAVILFAAVLVLLVLPATERAALEGKQETLRAIVASALSLCERHYAAEQGGTLTRDQAQALAAADLRALRYGESHKEYLWVTDHAPSMVLHPYRPDLEGRNLREYRDPDGVPLFVEGVRLVEHAEEGFLHYRWQRHDDSLVVAPKLSYVRGFAPWGWIVGSGLYLDDVEARLAQTRRTVLLASGVILLVLSVLVALGLRQGWISEQLRLQGEKEVRRSNARFQALAHAAEEAVLLVAEGRIEGVNRSACALLGRPEQQLQGMRVEELLGSGCHDLEHSGVPRELELRGAEAPIPALVSLTSSTVQGRPVELFSLRGLRPQDGLHLIERRLQAAEALLQGQLAGQAAWLSPVGAVAQSAPLLPLTASPDEVAMALRQSGATAVLLQAPDLGVAGIITGADLVRRGGQTAYEAMTSPVRTIPPETSLAETASLLCGRGHRQLVVQRQDEPPKLVDSLKLLGAVSGGIDRLQTEWSLASQSQLAGLRLRLDRWVATVSGLRIDPARVVAQCTRGADAALRRCLELSLEQFGPPPAPCALFSVGSQGRHEMVPGSDQDNALVFADGADPAWFEALCSDVVTRYADAGWEACHGGTTAAQWCKPLSAWRQQFDLWVERGTPKDLMEVATFFDLRAIWGDEALVADLRTHALQQAASRDLFLHQLTQEALDFRPPLGPFGAIRTGEANPGLLNVKGALIHFVAFARVLALRHALDATSTEERLRLLHQQGRLETPLYHSTLESWRFLQGLRVEQRCGPRADDLLDPSLLDGWRLAQLKAALTTVAELQSMLRRQVERAG